MLCGQAGQILRTDIKSTCKERHECEGWRGREGKKVDCACDGVPAFTEDRALDASANMSPSHVISPKGAATSGRGQILDLARPP